MAKIHQLSPNIIAKIAAGEVIERPAYAVKELVENAIDANADYIQIIIEKSGLQKIQIIDNGEGMSKEDLSICWKPHTTSKIKEDDSLIGIESFGFRGEALSSLSAVSQLTIRSRTHTSQLGNEIIINEGRLVTQNPVGMPEGSIVIAENLFANIPARKKFLKSTQTEMRHIIDVVTNFAASFPQIHFQLQHNNKILLDASPTKNKEERIHNLLGKDITQFLLPVTYADSYINFSGWITKPQAHANTTSKQLIYLNNRKVSDKLISLAVKEAFGNMLEPTAYPIFILFINIPYEFVDINVHPRKEQVSFIQPQIIFQSIKTAIIETLQENNITFQNLSWKRNGVGTTKTYAANLLKEKVLSKEKLHITTKTPMIQLHNTYIVTQSNNSILLTDQHAAHERIIFEKLKKEFIKQRNKSITKKLQNPLKLDLSITQKLLLTEHKKIFEKLGFIFSSFENTLDKENTSNLTTTILLTHVSQIFQDRDTHEYIQQLLDELEQGKPISNVDKTSEEMLAFLACRSAVKAGDSLDRKSMQQILINLEKASNSATCPHGRPTQVNFPRKEIDILFGRN